MSDDSPKFFEGVDVNDAAAVQAASDAASEWAEAQAAIHFEQLPESRKEQVLAQAETAAAAVVVPVGELTTEPAPGV